MVIKAASTLPKAHTNVRFSLQSPSSGQRVELAQRENLTVRLNALQGSLKTKRIRLSLDPGMLQLSFFGQKGNRMKEEAVTGALPLI